ncbi:hypothetical protein [Segetibacter koreensis]|uniref:hypothetical protein n=1 Tax=Segetibacter koreensis TaxID=398037 RepID=UPI0003733585|nr:hypothetical protein [Segetibacter koreensis]
MQKVIIILISIVTIIITNGIIARCNNQNISATKNSQLPSCRCLVPATDQSDHYSFLNKLHNNKKYKERELLSGEPADIVFYRFF